MYNVVNTLAPSFLIEASSYLQVTRTTIKSRLSSKIGLIRSCTAELAVIERLRLTMGEMLWTLVLSFLIGSSSFLWDNHGTWISLNFDQIIHLTMGLDFRSELWNSCH